MRAPPSPVSPVAAVLERAVDRAVRGADALWQRVALVHWNPLHQSGAVAAWLLAVLTVTGLYLLLWYRVGAPAESVQRLAADPWVGRWVRGVHRYATAGFVVAAAVHALRLVGQSRYWGPRARAWVSGLLLVALGLACAWTGYVMAWDSTGLRLALVGARLLDALPLLSEPVARIFAGDRPVPQTFFFLNLFVHIALPLALGVGLLVHVAHVARPVLAPPRDLRRGLTALLVAVAVLRPAPLGPPADVLHLPTHTPLDLTTAWWVPAAERAHPLVTWAVLVLGAGLVLLVPVAGRRPRTGRLAPSWVDPRLCTGCDQCTQDCPWEAIAMVPREDGREGLVALVDPARCVSCGICAASCAPMGVGPPQRTGRDQLVVLRQHVLPQLRPAAAAHGPVVVIGCSRAVQGLSAARLTADFVLQHVPCAGAVHTSVIELALRGGASGVAVVACPERDCTGREGPKWLVQRVYHDREAELQARVDRRRVALLTGGPGLAGRTVADLAAFRDRVAALGPVGGGDAAADPEALCEATEEALPG